MHLTEQNGGDLSQQEDRFCWHSNPHVWGPIRLQDAMIMMDELNVIVLICTITMALPLFPNMDMAITRVIQKGGCLKPCWQRAL